MGPVRFCFYWGWGKQRRWKALSKQNIGGASHCSQTMACPSNVLSLHCLPTPLGGRGGGGHNNLCRNPESPAAALKTSSAEGVHFPLAHTRNFSSGMTIPTSEYIGGYIHIKILQYNLPVSNNTVIFIIVYNIASSVSLSLSLFNYCFIL